MAISSSSDDMEHYVIGVDVGTNHVRAAIVSKTGSIVSQASHPITVWNPRPDFYQQSSDEIWEACCYAVKEVTRGIYPERIKGIGFAATSSMVVLGKDGNPLSVDLDGDKNQNVILWMDHRALEETHIVNNIHHSVLDNVGGKISCEVEIPKLLWLKRHMYKQCWKKAGYFMLLPEFLSWKATLSETRPLCSLICRWAYQASPIKNTGWNKELFTATGMEDIVEDNYWKKLVSNPEIVKIPGEKCGNVHEKAAQELGLSTQVSVACSAIDSYSGGMGLVGCTVPGVNPEFSSKILLICGTSTCHMVVSETELFVPGFRGPFYNAMIPGYWTIGGGQSVTGKLIDHIIDTHPASKIIDEKLSDTKTNTMEYLNNLLKEMAKSKNVESVDELTCDLHVYPDFHGNRSPLSDPTLKGMISGLTLYDTEENLALLYLATIQSLVYGTKRILEEIEKAGHAGIQSIVLCGGLNKNSLFLQTHANAVGLPVLSSKESEMALVGTAMLAASASNLYPSFQDAIVQMASPAFYIKPDTQTKRYHDNKYHVYLEMLNHQRMYKSVMSKE